MSDIYDQIELPEETGEKRIVYYLMGKRPIKITYVDDFPDYVMAFDFEKKKFVFDRNALTQVNNSTEAKRITENEFRDACLAVGVKPI